MGTQYERGGRAPDEPLKDWVVCAAETFILLVRGYLPIHAGYGTFSAQFNWWADPHRTVKNSGFPAAQVLSRCIWVQRQISLLGR